MSNGNAGFSIPGIYQPNILERVGALLQGKEDPIHKAQALDIEQKMGMMKLQQGQEELGIKKKAAEREEVKFQRGEEAVGEFQEAAKLFGKDPIGALSRMSSAAFKAGDKDAYFKIFEIGRKFEQDKQTQDAYNEFRQRLPTFKSAEEANRAVLDITAKYGTDALEKATRLLIQGGYPDETKEAKLSPINQPDYTPESFKAYMGSSNKPEERNRTLLVPRPPERAPREPSQMDLIASEISARREGKPPGSGHKPLRGLNTAVLLDQLQKTINPIDRLIGGMLEQKNKMRIKNKKTGEMAEGPTGPIPEGWEKVP